VGNRRALNRDLERELARAVRYLRPLSLVAIDVDHLKAINDQQGHAAGDDVLRHLTTELQRGLRVGDAVYRVGGDEFVLLLPDTAAEHVTRLLHRVEDLAPAFSYGVATAPDDSTAPEALLALADQRLLTARRLARTDGLDLRAEEDQSLQSQEQTAPPAEAIPSPIRASRPSIEQVRTTTGTHGCDTSVTLHWGGRRLHGAAHGSAAALAQRTTVAAAALEAVKGVDASLATTHIANVAMHRAEDNEAVLVHLVVPTPSVDEHLVGTAFVRSNLPDAIVRAVLDALNRRLSMRHPDGRAA
jgi:diguanylate cyclase (GGDEF)-like protein